MTNACWRSVNNLAVTLSAYEETRRPGRILFSTAGYRVLCRGQEESEGKKGLHEVELTCAMIGGDRALVGKI